MVDPFTSAPDSLPSRDTSPSSVFPSGDYRGYWLQSGQRGQQDLWLSFRRGLVTGFGTDRVGRFVIHGRYDDARSEVRFTKQYLGLHSVFYRGFRDGLVGIWGTWEIQSPTFFDRGGFHIWPKNSGFASRAEAVAAHSEPLVNLPNLQSP